MIVNVPAKVNTGTPPDCALNLMVLPPVVELRLLNAVLLPLMIDVLVVSNVIVPEL